MSDLSRTAQAEAERVRAEFERRAGVSAYEAIYSALNPGNLCEMQGLERALLSAFREHGLLPLQDQRVLDIGCGGGAELWRLIGYGFSAEKCAGIDLVPDRMAEARRRLPVEVKIVEGDASRLPFADGEFDVAFQFTVLSSILDRGLREAMARDVLRVLRPGGRFFSYDFWWNPVNPNTVGITRAELRRLFPRCCLTSRRITLAPPIARLIAPVSWTVAQLLTGLRVFNTHFLCVIEKPAK